MHQEWLIFVGCKPTKSVFLRDLGVGNFPLGQRKYIIPASRQSVSFSHWLLPDVSWLDICIKLNFPQPYMLSNTICCESHNPLPEPATRDELETPAQIHLLLQLEYADSEFQKNHQSESSGMYSVGLYLKSKICIQVSSCSSIWVFVFYVWLWLMPLLVHWPSSWQLSSVFSLSLTPSLHHRGPVNQARTA